MGEPDTQCKDCNGNGYQLVLDEDGNRKRSTCPKCKGKGRVPKAKRGFAAMDPAYVRQISRKGGKEAHARGTAYRFTKEKAAEAGRKGGIATTKQKQAVKSGK
jgi:uncharacterized protein